MTTATSPTAPVAPPSPTPATHPGRAVPAATAPLRAAVVGYGGAFNMGRQHLREMAAAGMVPTAVAEIDPARLAVAREDYPGIETYGAVADLLAHSAANVIAVITPHNTHAPIARQCLAAGRHVVCEKPLCLTTAEADDLIAAARGAGVVVSAYHNRHWDGCILEARRQIRDGGAIGEIVRIEAFHGGHHPPRDWWRASRSAAGGILYDWGVHLLEYALQLVASEIAEVAGFARSGHWAPQSRYGDDTIEDEASAVVRFRNGVWLTLTCSAVAAKGREGLLEITGTDGTYVMGGRHYRLIGRQDGKTTSVEGVNPDGEGHRYYENLAAHLRAGEPLAITAEWARRPVHIIDLAVRSAAAGRALPATYG